MPAPYNFTKIPEPADPGWTLQPANASVINGPLKQLDEAIGAEVGTLSTTARTLVGALNELDGILGHGVNATLTGTVTAAAFVGSGAALTGITGATGGVANTGNTTIGADTDASGAGVVALQTQGADRLTIANSGKVGIGTTTPQTRLHVLDGSVAAEIAPFVQVLVQNTGDTPGGSDYQNEVHLRLQAGTVADHRKYINFADKGGSDRWTMGSNALHTFILYNADTCHRLWFENDGTSYANAGGTEAFRVNYHPTDSAGTGGFIVHAGGAPTDNGRILAIYTLAAGMDNPTYLDLNGGLTAEENVYIRFQDRGTATWLIGKSSVGGFALYDVPGNRYPLYADAAGHLGVFNSNPSAPLHPRISDSETDAPSDGLRISHSTDAAPAAGFGVTLRFLLESSTTDDTQAAHIGATWADATHATRRGRMTLWAMDTAQREGLRIEADGSAAAKIGFLGATAVSKAAHIANPAGGATVDAEARTAINSILAALENYGLLATS